MKEHVPTVIVDRSSLFRAGLAHILAKTRFSIVAQCSELNDLKIDILADYTDCVVVVGLGKDPAAQLAQVSSLKEQHKHVRILIIGESFQPEDFIAILKSAADGYLLKYEVSADAILKGLDLILLGEVIVPRCFMQLIRNQVRAQLEAPADDTELTHEIQLPEAVRLSEVRDLDGFRQLSTRERLILGHLTRGASNKHIARELQIAEATIKVHVKAILRKIRVSNRTQAAMWAISHCHVTGDSSRMNDTEAL